MAPNTTASQDVQNPTGVLSQVLRGVAPAAEPKKLTSMPRAARSSPWAGPSGAGIKGAATGPDESPESEGGVSPVTTLPPTSTGTSDPVVVGAEVVGGPPEIDRVVVVCGGAVVGGEVLPVGNGRDVVVGRTVVLVGKRVVVVPAVVVVAMVVVVAEVVVVTSVVVVVVAVVVGVEVVVGAVVVEIVVVVVGSTTTTTSEAHMSSNNGLSWQAWTVWLPSEAPTGIAI
jgi:hypothetical protein